MFTCEKCLPSGVDSFWQLMLPKSYRKCEECKKRKVCWDIPGKSNNFWSSPEKQTDSKFDAGTPPMMTQTVIEDKTENKTEEMTDGVWTRTRSKR